MKNSQSRAEHVACAVGPFSAACLGASYFGLQVGNGIRAGLVHASFKARKQECVELMAKYM